MIFFLVLTFKFMSANASTYKAVPKSFPIEFELTLDFAQKNLPENSKKKFSSIIESIDKMAENLTEEERLFVSMTEVYKSLLRPENNDPIPLNFNYSALNNELKGLRVKYKKDPFLIWISMTTSADLNAIIESLEFRDLMLIKKSRKALSPNLLKIDRRLFLATKIAQELLAGKESGHPETLAKKALNTIDNVRVAFEILAKYSANLKTAGEAKPGLSFFVVSSESNAADKSNAKPEKEKNQDKSIEQILAPVIDGPGPRLPTPSNEADWVPKKETQEETKKDLPKPVNEDDWLPDF